MIQINKFDHSSNREQMFVHSTDGISIYEWRKNGKWTTKISKNTVAIVTFDFFRCDMNLKTEPSECSFICIAPEMPSTEEAEIAPTSTDENIHRDLFYANQIYKMLFKRAPAQTSRFTKRVEVWFLSLKQNKLKFPAFIHFQHLHLPYCSDIIRNDKCKKRTSFDVYHKQTKHFLCALNIICRRKN